MASFAQYFWFVVTMIVCVPACYLFLLSAAGFAARRRSPDDEALQTDGTIAFVIPAHNEAAVIGRTIDNLKSISDQHCRVHIVADNCSDETAMIARTSGAFVYERADATQKSKGHALAWLMPQVIQYHMETDGKAPLALVVVDADGTLSQNSVKVARQAFARGETVLQSEYLLDSGTSLRSRVMAIAFAAINVVRGLGRSQWGVTDTLKGNGMWFRTDVLLQFPWRAFSLAEDLEYGLMLRRAGINITFLRGSVATGLPGEGDTASTNQRARWESGRLALVMKEMPEAAAQLLQKPSLANLDLLLELATPPLTFYATILTTLLLMSFAFSMQIGSVVCGAWVCMIGLAAVILHLVSAVPLTGMPMRNLYDLAGVPFFLIWKLLLLPRIWRERKSKVWIRTERTPSPTTKK